MTNEQKDNLTGLCKIEIKRWKAASESNPNMRYMAELMEIALAALTAQPDDWKQRAEAAEAKLAELEKQEPVKLPQIIQIGYTHDEITAMCNVRNDAVAAIRAAGYQVESE